MLIYMKKLSHFQLSSRTLRNPGFLCCNGNKIHFSSLNQNSLFQNVPLKRLLGLIWYLMLCSRIFNSKRMISFYIALQCLSRSKIFSKFLERGWHNSYSQAQQSKTLRIKLQVHKSLFFFIKDSGESWWKNSVPLC